MKKRIINTNEIKEIIVDLVYKTNFSLPHSVEEKFREMIDNEESALARETLGVIVENAALAREEELPLCQDCGVVIIFMEIGQDVALEGEPLEKALNGAVEDAYKKFNLRKSVVGDPLKRVNTATNTPAFIHTELVEGDKISITVYLKGGGSENMTALKMFRPTDSVDLIVNFIEETVIEAGPNPCPPIFLGVGIGGTADVALLNSKKAVLRGIGTRHSDPFYSDLEIQIEEHLNASNIGPLGFGGHSTTGGVFIKEAPAHIASLPVALNLNCHSLRYKTVVL
ncbi:MAG: fumarate hydratase [bacterium]|nr:fumarate hydratase [bacterium]